MSSQPLFELISTEIKQGKFTCVLIGGFALSHYHVSRQTADVDFLILKEDFGKLIPALTKVGYRVDHNDSLFARLHGSGYPYMDLDFLFVDKETLEKIVRSGKHVKISGKEFVIPALEHLIALKLHAIKNDKTNREVIDLPDIVRLIKANSLDVKKKSFRELCLKYGHQEIYDKIIDYTQDPSRGQ